MKLNRHKLLAIMILTLGIMYLSTGVGLAANTLTVNADQGSVSDTSEVIVAEVDTTGTKDYSAGEVVTLTVSPSDGYVFTGWEGDFPAGQKYETTIDVTMDTAKSLTANFALEGQVNNLAVNPNYIAFNSGYKEYDFRVDAVVPDEEKKEKITISFEYTGDASTIHVLKAGTNDPLTGLGTGGVSVGDGEVSGVNYKDQNRVITLDISRFKNIDIGESYEIRFSTPDGPKLLEFTLRGTYQPPKLEVTLENQKQYGVLDQDEVYFVNNKDNVLVDVSANSDLLSQRYVASVGSTSPSTFGASIPLTGEGWPEVSSTDDIDAILNNSLESQYLDDWSMDALPINSELDIGEQFKVVAVRIKAYARGASGGVDQTFYLAIDKKEPEIDSMNPGIDVEELADSSEAGQITKLNENSTNDSTPEIKLNLKKDLSEVSNDNVLVRAIELNKLAEYKDDPLVDIVEEFSTRAGSIVDDQDFDTKANQSFQVLDYSSKETKRIAPIGELNEGVYVIRVTIKDDAGNYNDQTTGDLTGDTFLLKVNTSQPIINDINLKDNEGNDADSTISSNGGRLQFDVINGKELYYQIRNTDDSNWKTDGVMTVAETTAPIDKKFSDLNVDLKDGTYEVIMAADDIELQADLINILENITLDPNSDIETQVLDTVKTELDNRGINYARSRTTVRAFRFYVDGSKPTVSNIKYINPQTEEEVGLNPDGTFGKLYTATPSFQVTITDESEIRNLDIDIDDINAGVISEKPKENKFIFTPNAPLPDGKHSIYVNVEDEWGNQNDASQPYEGKWTDVFISQKDIADEITFSVKNNSSIKEASAIEVELALPDEKTIDKDTLKVRSGGPINGELIVDGKSKAAGADKFEIISFNDWDRFIIFAMYPWPDGQNEITVIVDDGEGNTISKTIKFSVYNKREGFGFGRLGKFLLEKAKKLEDAGN